MGRQRLGTTGCTGGLFMAVAIGQSVDLLQRRRFASKVDSVSTFMVGKLPTSSQLTTAEHKKKTRHVCRAK